MWVYLFKLAIAIPVLSFALWVFLKGAQQSRLLTSMQTHLIVKDTLRVSPKGTIQVIQAGEQWLLISVTEQQVTVLKELSEAEAKPWKESQPSLPQGGVPTLQLPTKLPASLRRWFENKCQK